MLEGPPEHLLERRLVIGRSQRATGYDEAGLEEQLGRDGWEPDRRALGVTRVGVRGDVNRRVQRLRRALWSVFSGYVSARKGRRYPRFKSLFPLQFPR